MYILRWIILLGFTSLVTTTYGQQEPVPVEKSNERVVIEGKIYYVHIVKPGQTLYGISKAYHVSEKAISVANPVLVTGLQAGQVLKIPYEEEARNEPEIRDTEHYIYHTMEEGETLYSLSKQYNVTVQEIESCNPDMETDDIPIGSVLKIPKKQFVPDRETFAPQQPRFRYHRVQSGETLYSLARKYDVSVRSLRKVNKGVRNQLNVGQFIRIPVNEGKNTDLEKRASQESEEATGNVPCNLNGGNRFQEGRAVLLLPLYLDENDVRFYIDSTQINPETGKRIKKVIHQDQNWIYAQSRRFLSFYEGVRVAASDLASQNIDFNLDVYDTKRNPQTVDSLIDAGVLDDADLIIGPVYPVNVDLVARYARKHDIPIISPLSRSDDFLRFNPWAIQVRPSRLEEEKKMAEYLAGHYKDNIVLVHTSDSSQYQEISDIKSTLNHAMSSYTYPEDVSIKEVYLSDIISPRDTVNTLELALKKDRQNIVWVISDDEGFVSEVVSRLNTYLREDSIQLYGNSSWLYFENIQPDYFFNLHLHLLTPRFVNYKDSVQLHFVKKFRDHYFTDPDIFSLAWDGYDIAYYFLSAWSRFGKQLPECIPYWHPELTTTAYYFKRTGWFSGLMNTHFSMLRYGDHFTVFQEPLDDMEEDPMTSR